MPNPQNFIFEKRGTPLTKTFTKVGKKLVKSAYPRVYEVSSVTEEYSSLDEFSHHLQEHAALGHCLLKGNLLHPLDHESRAGSTSPLAPTHWVCLDLDGLTQVKTVEQFLKLLGLHDVDHIVQYSASMGVDPGKGLSAHIFLLLEEPTSPALLKQWLTWCNLTIPELEADLQLTRSNAALRWPLDVSTCQNDKLIYIAPPVLGRGVKDTLSGDRIQLHKRSRTSFSLPSLPDTTEIRALQVEKLNALREAAGLKKSNATLRVVKGVEVQHTSQSDAKITGVKTDRGFVYMNLNGGDSWAYYHPETDPYILYNFKGEPNYVIPEILPDYYVEASIRANALQTERKAKQRSKRQQERQAKLAEQEARRKEREAKQQAKAEQEASRAERRKMREERKRLEAEEAVRHAEEQERLRTEGNRDAEGVYYLVFRDIISDRYFRGTYNPETTELDIAAVSNETKLIHFLQQHGQPVPDFIPEMTLTFDPHSTTVFDLAAGKINLFRPTPYMRNPDLSARAIPPTIRRVLLHALGNDEQALERFINWLAFIWQRRRMARTAWILSGTQGTGKGATFHLILRPLFGTEHCAIRTLENLEEQYNEYMQRCLLLFVDEVQISESSVQKRLMSKIKNLITEPLIPLRAMRANQSQCANFMSVICASNKPDPVHIDREDRRFSTGEYQPEKLQLSATEEAQVLAELPKFAGYLAKYAVDETLVHTPYINDTRTHMQDTTANGAEDVARALRDGDLEFFVDLLPTNISPASVDVATTILLQEYKRILDQSFMAVRQNDGVMNIPREDLRVLFESTIGGMPASPHKFTSRLRHLHLHMNRVRVGGHAVRGIQVTWKASAALMKSWGQHIKKAPLEAVS